MTFEEVESKLRETASYTMRWLSRQLSPLHGRNVCVVNAGCTFFTMRASMECNGLSRLCSPKSLWRDLKRGGLMCRPVFEL